MFFLPSYITLKVRLINEVTGCQGSTEPRVDRCIIYFASFLPPNMLLDVVCHSPLLLFSCSYVRSSQEFCRRLSHVKAFSRVFTKFVTFTCDL